MFSKKTRILALSLVLVMVMAACGSTTSGTSATGSATASGSSESTSATSNLKFFTDKNTPIQMIIPYGAGGGTDTVGRKVQSYIQESLGKTIVATNMPGGSGAIGADYCSKQPADGFNLMFFPETLGLYPAMAQSDLTVNDFIMVYAIDSAPGVFVTQPDSQFKTAADITAYAKENPGKIKIASSGVGDAWHLCAALFMEYADVEVEVVPYNSGKDAALAALKGEVNLACCGLIEAVDFLKNSQLTAICVFAPDGYEIEGYGSIPSVADTYTEMKDMLPAGSWHGAYLPKDTPQEIVDAYVTAFDEATGTEEFKQYCDDNGLIQIRKSYPESQRYALDWASKFSWFLYDAGFAVREPSVVGIERLK